MRIPMSWVRILLGFVILLLCLYSGRTPARADKGSVDYAVCKYSPCKGYSYQQSGGICDFYTTNAGWTCTDDPNNSCGYNSDLFGSITCAGTIRDSNPPQLCRQLLPCCSSAPPPSP